MTRAAGYPAGAMAPSLDRDRLAALLAHEEATFRTLHPRSVELHQLARASLLGGVPMTWMIRWAGRVPLFVDQATGAHVRDVDGHEYVDLCLGDTGAMAGHSPAPTVEAIRRAAARGITTMLPTEDAIWVGEELARRFGLPIWQLTPYRHRRQPLRAAHRATCHRPPEGPGLRRLLPRLRRRDPRHPAADGSAGPRPGSIGPPLDPVSDDAGGRMERHRRAGSGARGRRCGGVLAEPVMTNIGIVQPDAGYHAAFAGADATRGDAAGHRRDAHDLRGPRRLHAALDLDRTS